MRRKKKLKKTLEKPPDGAMLVWEIKKGESFRDSMNQHGKIAREADLRYLKTGEKVWIRVVSEDEIEVSL